MAALTTFYRSADRVTGVATAAITGGQLLKVSAARADGENIHVAPAGAGDVVFGVAGADAANGATVPVIREGVVGLLASGNITAGQAVKVAADGTIAVATGASGTVTVTGDAQADVAVTMTQASAVIGIAVDDIANGATGPVALTL